ncbi:8-oxoguanine DNA glycosylase OGG fold protein [Arthrobacter sp. R4-81]
MPAVPDDLQRRFQKWDANDRPPQDAFEWKQKTWQRYLDDSAILETLPNPIGRSCVLETFKLIKDRDSALDAYIASYLWGYAKANFGPYRAERVIRLNTDPENGKDFAVELHTLAQIAMTNGGNAAFQHVVDRRQSHRKFFDQWGPAFATKFISFATKAADQMPTMPIMDSIVAQWFRNHCKEVGPLRLNWHSASSYRRYTECMAKWAQELDIEPDQVEQLIFAKDGRPVLRV